MTTRQEICSRGRDIVIDEQPHYIRMFGSLRAVEDCQQCHDVPQRTLLGAFTYELKKPAASVSLKRLESAGISVSSVRSAAVKADG